MYNCLVIEDEPLPEELEEDRDGEEDVGRVAELDHVEAPAEPHPDGERPPRAPRHAVPEGLAHRGEAGHEDAQGLWIRA